MPGKRLHKNCGGVVKNNKCSKCGKTWGHLGSLLGKDIEDKPDKFDPLEYRKRIGGFKDIT